MSPRVPALLALCAAAAAESAAGVAAPPAPGALPLAWVALGNDDFGRTARSGDDHRTNQAILAGRVGEDAVIVLDHSILTDRRANTRSDELTATAAWLPFGDGGDRAPRIELGGGVRPSGRIFGESLQNGCHKARDFRCLYLDYERAAVTAVAYGDAVWRAVAPVRGDVDACVEAEATGLVTSWVAAQVDLAARGVVRWRGDQAKAWTGVRARFSDGNGQSATARATADFERGVWIEYGASWRMWSLSGGVNTRIGFSYGAIAMAVKDW